MYKKDVEMAKFNKSYLPAQENNFNLHIINFE